MRKNYFIWASDISNSTGEGVLARNFLKDLNIKKNKKIIPILINKLICLVIEN